MLAAVGVRICIEIREAGRGDGKKQQLCWEKCW